MLPHPQKHLNYFIVLKICDFPGGREGESGYRAHDIGIHYIKCVTGAMVVVVGTTGGDTHIGNFLFIESHMIGESPGAFQEPDFQRRYDSGGGFACRTEGFVFTAHRTIDPATDSAQFEIDHHRNFLEFGR